MQIAILGASSHISKGLIKLFLKNDNNLKLFVRDKTIFHEWIRFQDIKKNVEIFHYDEFNNEMLLDLIINCIGVGDPQKLVNMGSSILEVTKIYDDLAIDFLEKNSNTKYIFFSSGAVYGNIFSSPANEHSSAMIDLNFQSSSDYYALAKLYSEARHRSLSHLDIVDFRIFNYISAELNIRDGFFISQVINALIDNTQFITNSTNIMRDFVGPEDLYSLIEIICQQKEINSSFDIYSKEPIDKFSILDFLQSSYGLSYKVKSQNDFEINKDFKENYYSTYHKAHTIGYSPLYTSIENIDQSIREIIDNKNISSS